MNGAPGGALRVLEPFTGTAREGAKIAALARHYGATVEAPRGPALDLEHEADPDAACVAFLSSFKNC